MDSPLAPLAARKRAQDAARRARARRQRAQEAGRHRRAVYWMTVAAVWGGLCLVLGAGLGAWVLPRLAPVPVELPASDASLPPPPMPQPYIGQAYVPPAPVQAPPQPAPPDGPARVAIIIDDLAGGAGSAPVVAAMPAGVTLSFLPFGEGLQAQVDAARADGHEVWLHLPMEPLGHPRHGHPMMLRPGFADAELDAALAAFTGYAGVNNHMGSRLTQDSAEMARVMAALSERGVPFIDSRTIASSVACEVAADAGVPCAARDVFLDHDPAPGAIAQELERLEAAARRTGRAIAIGHPTRATLQALEAWLPTLPGKGITLVPASALLPQ
jgi:uncharacterized protein